MALQAKFLKMGKSGALAIYEVRGTSAELATYVANNFKNSPSGPSFKSTKEGKPILDANGNKTPLYFTAYPLPGKNLWHPMYEIQMGDNAGSFTLDKQELQFEVLVSKSMGADFGQAYAAQAAQRYAQGTPVSSSASSMLTDDEEEDEDFTAEAEEEVFSASEDANLTVTEQAPDTKGAKANK